MSETRSLADGQLLRQQLLVAAVGVPWIAPLRVVALGLVADGLVLGSDEGLQWWEGMGSVLD